MKKENPTFTEYTYKLVNELEKENETLIKVAIATYIIRKLNKERKIKNENRRKKKNNRNS